VNAHDKHQDDIAKPDEQTQEMIGMLEAVDQRITPQHVAQRYRELLDDIADSPPTPLASQLVSLQSVSSALVEAEGV
jgi:hypothetical protein